MVPKTMSYDEEFCEEVIMKPSGGVTGFEIYSIEMDISKKMIQFTHTEGVLKEDGSSLELESKERIALRLSEQQANEFYTENKTAIDSLLKAAVLKIAAGKGKTGTINE